MNTEENLKKIISKNDINEFHYYIINNNINLGQYGYENNEKIKELIIKKRNNKILSNELSKSIYLENITFDPLIYAIEKKCSYYFIKFIINKYYNLNYDIKNGKNPLFVALQNNYFSIADLLLKKNADIHYMNNKKKNIIQYLLDNDKLSKKHLKFLLNRRFNINHLVYCRPKFNNKILKKTTFEYIMENAKTNAKPLFNIILNHVLYNNDFILKFIGILKHQKCMSDKTLNNLIHNEKKKLYINKGLYETVINCNDPEILKSLFFYDVNFDNDKKRNSITNEETGYKLLSNSVSVANFEILKLLNEKGFNVNEFNDCGTTPLIQAIYFNKIDFIHFLVESGADVNKRSKKDEFPIISAVKKHNNKILSYLFENGANPNQKNMKGYTALMYTAQFGNIPSAKTLMDYNADINAQNEQGLTALNIALISNRTEMVKFLLNQNQINLKLKSHKGMNALMYAARQSNYENFQLLMDKLKTNNIDIDINDTDNEGLNALLHACYCGGRQIYVYLSNSYFSKLLSSYYNIIESLINNGINLHKKSKYGQNALMIASEFSCLTIVKMLVEQGMDINEVDNNGCNALMFACRSHLLTFTERLRDEREELLEEYPDNEILRSLVKNVFDIDDINYKYTYRDGKFGYIHLVKYLVEQGIDLFAKDKHGNNALMEAASHGFINIIEYLLEKGISLDDRNNEGYTALMYASKNGYLNIVKCLVDHGANINDLDNNGNNSLMLASSEGYIEIVEYLKNMGLSIHAKNKEGKNAFMLAILGNHLNIVQYLQQQGINLYEKDNYGCNALMLAARHGKSDIVQYLCNNDIDPNIIDNRGWTSLMYATYFNGNKKYPFTSQRLSTLSTLINNYFNIIKCLVEHGAQLNNKNYEGTTALMLACLYSPLQVVKYLINMGATLDIVDNKGNDVLNYAEDSLFFENYLNLMKSKIEKPVLNSYYTPIIEATCIPKTTSDIYFCHDVSHFKSNNYELLENYLKSQKRLLDNDNE